MENWHPNPDFFFQPGGGPVLDLGPYYIGNLIHLLGPGTLRDGHVEHSTKANARSPVSNVMEKIQSLHRLRFMGVGVCQWCVDHFGCELGYLATRTPQHGAVRNRRFSGCAGSELLWWGNCCAVNEMASLGSQCHHPFGIPNQEKSTGAVANYRASGLADLAAAIQTGRGCSLLHRTTTPWSGSDDFYSEFRRRPDRSIANYLYPACATEC